MSGFIEVTEITSGVTILVAVSEIRSVVCRGSGFVFIETGYDTRRDESTGITVKETYDEILQKLQNVSG